MTTIQSQTTIDKPVSEVYFFLEDCRNHEQLMPDNILNWSSTHDEASFTIQNMITLSLRVANRVVNEEVAFVPVDKAPFEVQLRWKIVPEGEDKTLASLVVEADLNMMMKLVAVKPLQKLVDFQVERLKNALG